MHLKRQTLKFSIPSDVFTAVPQNDRMNLVQYELVKERERGARERRAKEVHLLFARQVLKNHSKLKFATSPSCYQL